MSERLIKERKKKFSQEHVRVVCCSREQINANDNKVELLRPCFFTPPLSPVSPLQLLHIICFFVPTGEASPVTFRVFLEEAVSRRQTGCRLAAAVSHHWEH